MTESMGISKKLFLSVGRPIPEDSYPQPHNGYRRDQSTLLSTGMYKESCPTLACPILSTIPLTSLSSLLSKTVDYQENLSIRIGVFLTMHYPVLPQILTPEILEQFQFQQVKTFSTHITFYISLFAALQIKLSSIKILTTQNSLSFMPIPLNFVENSMVFSLLPTQLSQAKPAFHNEITFRLVAARYL